MAITAIITLLAAASTATATGGTSLERFAEGINAPRDRTPIDIRNAVVVGETLTADIIIADPLELTPDAIKDQTRHVICGNPTMRNLLSTAGVELRFNVSAPNWPAPVPTSFRTDDCEAPSPSREEGKGTPTSVQAAPQSVSSSFDFKGVPLGISYEEFRRLPHPDGAASQIVCTGEKIAYGSAATSPLEVSIFNRVHTALGVRKCVWISASSYALARSAPLRLAGSGYATIEYSFSFVPDPRDGVLRLFQFQGLTNRSAEDAIIRALTAKFGSAELRTGVVQNGIGNRFDQVTAVWSDATGSLLLQSPSQSVDRMTLLMTDTRLSGYVADQEAAAQSAVPNGI